MADERQEGGIAERDFRLVKQVLSEMIQTIAVLDRICYLAERAGLFTFDFRQLLDDYLGDVQVVTEFEENRKEILVAFRDVWRRPIPPIRRRTFTSFRIARGQSCRSSGSSTHSERSSGPSGRTRFAAS